MMDQMSTLLIFNQNFSQNIFESEPDTTDGRSLQRSRPVHHKPPQQPSLVHFFASNVLKDFLLFTTCAQQPTEMWGSNKFKYISER